MNNEFAIHHSNATSVTTEGFRHSITINQIRLFPLRAIGGVSPKMAIGSMPTRPALLVRIDDTDGCHGWGEVWANFPPRANQHKAHLIEDVITPAIKGTSFVEPREVEIQLRETLSVYFLHIGQQQIFEHILAGLDTALWDLALRKEGKSFAEFMQLTRTEAPTYASSINVPDLERLIPHHTNLGQKFFKIKIGFLGKDEQKAVARAHELCPNDARLMIDSNQSWALKEAQETLASLEAFDPYFAEESLPANAPLKEWEQLANATSIPLAGGENIYGINNFQAMANAGLKILQPDVAKWGGVTGALDLAAQLPAGTQLWPHFMGSAVGQMAAVSIAAAVGEQQVSESVCEVDVNDNQLREDLCGDVGRINQGCVELQKAPGLVAEPLTEQLKELAA